MIHYILDIFTVLIFLIICWIIYYYKIKEYRKTEYFKITQIPYFSMRNDPGRVGEYYTYKYLTQLPGKKRFLFNCYIPDDNDNTTEIDVLMIHESGIYVFESKNYGGWIFGSENQKYWTQSFAVGHGRGKTRTESFFNPIWQNRKHIKWLQEYLKDSALPVYSYIVFSERCELKKLNLKNQEHVVKRNDVLSAVSAQASAAGSVFSHQEIDKIYQSIYPLSQADETIRKKHIQNINDIKIQQNQNISTVKRQDKQENAEGSESNVTKVCPRCGGKMILRTARKGKNAGKKFYGCSNYPYCHYIENDINV